MAIHSFILSLFLSLLLSTPGIPVIAAIGRAIPPQRTPMTSGRFAQQRKDMVEQQLRPRGIQDPQVLQAMATVEREQFVEPTYRDLAYANFPLPIGHQQTISQPYIVAYMTQAAEIAPDDIVLEIGTGSGYQAAVLAELAQAVYSVEIQPALAHQAQQRLQHLNYQNVQVKTGDGYQGWAEHAPYDAILVTAAPERVPEPLLQQLALTGKLVIPVGKTMQNLLVIQKTADGFLQERTLPVQFVPMTGQASR